MRRASALLLYALGCSRTSAPPSPPSPASVEPAAGYVSRDTPVLLHGDGFDPSVVQHLSAGSHLALDADFSASLGQVELREVRWIDSHTLAAVVPAGVTAGMYGLTVRGPFGSGAAQGVYQAVDSTPAAFVATVAAPSRALVGADMAVTVTVSNSGAVPALGVAAGPVSASGPAVSVQAPPETMDIAAGASQSFTWHFTASAAGLLTLTLPVAGTDSIDGSAVTTQGQVSIVVVTPAHLTATALRAPQSQPAGPAFEISADVLNDGGSDAVGVQFDALSAPAIVSVLSAPDPQDIPAGATRTFRWTVQGTDAGTATLASSSSATDSTGGGPISLGPLRWTVILFKAVVLDAVLSLPPGALPNEIITVTLTVRNPGLVDALAVQPSISVSGSGAVTVQTAPVAADIPAGQSATFTWTYAVAAPGTVRFDAASSGTDAQSGNPVTANASGTIEIGDVVPVAANPFSDGAQFASVFTYAGRVYLGPSADGAEAVRMSFDGTGVETVRFGFETDFAKITNRVSPTPTAFPTLGFIGCVPDTLQCGPDNEDGRGLFTSLTVGGQEWLFAAGGRGSSMLKHAYLSTDTRTTPSFPFVALGLSGGTRTATGVAGLGTDLYLAFANSGGSGTADLIRMSGLPPDSSQPLNPTLSNVLLPNTLRSSRTGLIDSMLAYGGWLYAANDGNTFTAGGCARYDGAAWVTCTPSQPQWVAKQSISTTKSSDFVPSDKAVPQMAIFAGHLYLARNTTTGPQLWGCAPTGGVCSPGDWSLVAPNLGGDVQLSQMNDSTLGTVSLLAASSQHLYVGYDSPGGLALFRSVASVPAAVSDFSSTGVPGLGASLTRIVDGRALTLAAKEFLYVAARPDTGPVRVYRLAP